MSVLDPTFEPLLDRYLAGEATPEEIARVQAWATTSGRTNVLASLHLLQRSRQPALLTPDAIQQAKHRLMARIAEDTHAVTSATSNARRRAGSSARAPWPLVAAAAAVLLVVAGLWVVRPTARVGTPTRYATRMGERATITLRDGTRVRLAPESQLDVASDFGARTRDVSLAGEAYFEVARTDGTPFTVHTSRATTRVLGTAFDVRAYTVDSAIRVAVVTGKVAVSGSRANHAPVTLTAGMAAVVPDSSGIAVASSNEAHSALWIDGQMAFHDAPVTAVLAAMTRWYGYRFRLADSTLTRVRLTLDLSTESSQTALATLKDVMNVTLTFDHDVIVVSPARQTQAPIYKQDRLTSPVHEVGR